MSKRKRRFTREFKLGVLAHMETAETVAGLAVELGICRYLLHKWRRVHEAGGAAGLRPIGRPPIGRRLDVSKLIAAPPSLAPAGDLTAARREIEELHRKVGQQQLDLDFFHAALRRVREQRLENDVPGERASTR